MRRKTLLTFLCCLTFKDGLGRNTTVSNDSVSGMSQLLSIFRDAPAAIYASAAPHGAFSFHTPVYRIPSSAGPGPVVPIHNENIVIQKQSGYLTDSYGNKFLQTPQQVSYKTTFPQQFVPLQDLPAHLSQPLVAASPGVHFKHNVPHFSYGAPIRIQSFQVAKTPSNTPVGFSAPQSLSVYAEKTLLSAPLQSRFAQYSTGGNVAQQPSNQKLIYSNSSPFEYSKAEPVKFQRLEYKPNDHGSVQTSKSSINQQQQKPVQTNANLQKPNPVLNAPLQQVTITTVNNGKKSVIALPTNPPVPHLLDLSLLEPLVFANPVVPQVQHYLPRINFATYSKVPELNQEKKQHKEFLVQNTKHYSTPVTSSPPKEEQNEEVDYSSEDNSDHSHSNEQSNDFQPIVHKEPIQYNDEKKKNEREPNYHFKVQNDKQNTKHSQEKDGPRHLIYTANPEEQDNYHSSDENDSSEESQENDEDEAPRHYPVAPTAHYHQQEYHEDSHSPEPTRAPEAPRHYSVTPTEHYHRQEYHKDSHNPKSSRQPETPHHHPVTPTEHYHQQEYHQESHSPKPTRQPEAPRHFSVTPTEHYHQQEYHQESHSPKPSRQPETPHHHPVTPTEHYHQQEYHQESHSPKPTRQPEALRHYSVTPTEHYHQQEYHQESHSPKPSKQPETPHHHPVTPTEHYHQQEYHQESYSPKPSRQPETPRHYPVRPTENYHRQEYHEESHSPKPTRQPEQHYTRQDVKDRVPKQFSHHTASVKQANLPNTQEHFQPIRVEWEEKPQPNRPTPEHNSLPSPIFHELEKSERIIIKEETPVDMHSLKEKTMAEMIKEEENNEEDFEKAYKNAAFGFPGFDRDTNIEKSVYSPGSYGLPRYTDTFDFENVPFQQYQSEGDEFPKSSRLTYKDTRDNNKDKYYSEYKSQMPQAFKEYSKQKDDYYKMYRHHKPENYFANNNKNDKPKKSEQYRTESVFDYKPTPKKNVNYFAKYKTEPVHYEFDYSKGTPRDSHAHPSKANHNYRHKVATTHFVEPQFQYGFEPLPRLLDSELAAMASNDSPESDAPGTRKKMFKENWYIHKTSTSGSEPTS